MKHTMNNIMNNCSMKRTMNNIMDNSFTNRTMKFGIFDFCFFLWVKLKYNSFTKRTMNNIIDEPEWVKLKCISLTKRTMNNSFTKRTLNCIMNNSFMKRTMCQFRCTDGADRSGCADLGGQILV